MKKSLGIFVILASLIQLSCSQAEQSEPREVRRIVTTVGADGRSLILADGPSTNVVELNGSRIERLWETDGIPVRIPVQEDRGATAGNAYREGFVGSSLYTADIPPGSSLEDIPIHAQDSLDYIVLLSGEIDLILDTGERLIMRPGDVLVQAGNAHSWVNKGSVTARLLCVVLTGERGEKNAEQTDE